ncbi:ABC transporter ATP-binding protein [Aquamicrobium sp. LC103]|uniref:ABC transporter ATP-binding protein n=1 Tax=Aquamicrobium sp. LC103 TaxID=1120658 RepID=UPI00063E95F6|nr:ABC transporter ATP-binding protein [Aquamicrobium sp. LC103]TKT69802.1 ABC transporter ATP-binding protein [Aquamicrobium sp. LC103]
MNMPLGTKAAGLDVRKLVASYRGLTAVDGISFSIPPSKFLTLLGPSGCGKSTTLRSVAGLHQIDAGEIRIGEIPVATADLHIRPEHREINMVFQSYAIWPHMTVADNVAYGLKMKGLPREVIRKQVTDMLDLVGLTAFSDRMATGLSGGQQQRVALARALATQPRILLLDEPLSNLDSVLRNRMRCEIMRIQRELGTTTLYVTHDCAEALSMSDRILVMDKGQIAQAETPEGLYRYPASRFVAEFIGQANVVLGIVLDVAETEILVEVSGLGQDLKLNARRRPEDKPAKGQIVDLIIRPESLRQATPQDTQVVSGRILQKEFLGSRTEVSVRVGEETLRLDTVDRVEGNPGDRLQLSMPSDAIVWAPASSN